MEHRVAVLLEALRPEALVSAPAAGADLIVLAAAQRLEIPVHIIIGIEPEVFIEQSVADAGAEWVARFYRAIEAAEIDHASTVSCLGLDSGDGGGNGSDGSDAEAWYLTANAALLERADRIADGRPVIAVTIRPIGGEHPPSGTDDLAERAEGAGLVVLTLDPRPAASVDVRVG